MAATYGATTSPGSWFSPTVRPPPPSSPVRIPPLSNRNNNSNSNNNNNQQRPKRFKQKSADASMLSKSLGTYPHPNFFRQSTNVSQIITYAGCLYKRSNHPVTSPTSVTGRSAVVLPPELPFCSSDAEGASLSPAGTAASEHSNQTTTTRGSPAWNFVCQLLDLSPSLSLPNHAKDEEPTNDSTTPPPNLPQQQQQQQSTNNTTNFGISACSNATTRQSISSSPIPVPLTSSSRNSNYSHNHA